MTFKKTRSTALAMAMLGLAAPAAAQSFCGGAGNGGVWIGGDEASSDIATAGTYLEQMALVLGGNEYVSLFTLSAPTEVRVEAEGRGAGDPVIDLLDSNGSLILSDDDSGGNAASRAERFLEAGTYCMALRSYDGGPMTAFVRMGTIDQEALTEGVIPSDGSGNAFGSCADAVDIGPLGSSASASVLDTPYWSFTLNAPTPVTITAENETADPVITLYDAQDNYINDNDDFDGLNSRLDMTDPLAAGTYCIAMEALSDEGAPITVTVSEYDAASALLALYDRGDAAPPLDGSIPFTELGVLESRLRMDVEASGDVSWFTMDITETSLVVIEAIATGGNDPWLVIFDDLGRMVDQNDDHGDGLDSMVLARVEPGTYIVGVKDYGGGTGFIRMLAERYVRAQ